MQTITFYLLSQIRILNHLSISLPSFISNIYSHSHTDLPLSVSLPINHPPYIQPAHLVTVLVKYECVQWSVVVWSAALAMSFVSGLNRELSSHSEAQAEVHAVRCNSEDNSKQALALSLRRHFARCKRFMSAMLSPTGATVSFRNKSSCSELKRSLAWSCGGGTRGNTRFFRASASILRLFSLPQPPKPI